MAPKVSSRAFSAMIFRWSCGENDATFARKSRGCAMPSGRLPVNTDGGLIANGEPVGASGLRQVHELVTQLRGRAGQRQVANSPQVALAQLYGAPGVAAVSVLTT